MEEKRRILIVDDEPDVLRILEKRLAGNGFEVLSADGGARALQKARKERPDLIILDIDMPDMDGGEVAARLKEDDATRHIPIIFLSCLVTQREEEEKGAPDQIFMAKPYNPAKLLEEIGRLV